MHSFFRCVDNENLICMFTFIVYVVDKIIGFLGNIGVLGFFGLMTDGNFDIVLMCTPLLLVGLVWGIITVPLTIAPRAYWAFSPLNVMGMKVGGVINSMLTFYFSPMIFLMCIYAI